MAAVVLTAFLYPAAGVALCVGLLVAGAGVPLLIAALSRRNGRATADARAELSTHVGSVLDGAADLLAYGAEDRALAECGELARRQSALTRTAARVAGAGAGLALLAAGGTVWVVALLAAPAAARGGLDPVTLAVVVLVAVASFEVVTTLPAVATALAAARRSAVRLFDVLDAPDPVREPEAPLPPPEGPVTVRLRSVGIRYAPEEPWALDGIDLDLPPGRRVAVVGPSGSGKSTLISVLLRFRDIDRGRVTLDGRELQAYGSDQVRRCIGGCPADPHVFTGTVRQNLQLARPEADLPRLESAAAQAGLLPWIRSLPEGWSTQVGHRGSRMSGGERQRLALARALLADPAVLVLDEPTAHLDPDARAMVMSAILAATRGRTLVLVTHDRTALAEMDEVVVLDAGRVVQRGTDAQLRCRPGLYRQMSALDGAVDEPAAVP
jgi:ATP-binding cassette, subfamily C, bacterial CydC